MNYGYSSGNGENSPYGVKENRDFSHGHEEERNSDSNEREREIISHEKWESVGELAETSSENVKDIYVDPRLLGGSAVFASEVTEGEKKPGLGEIVDIGKDVTTTVEVPKDEKRNNFSKLQKNGVSKLLKQRLDEIKQIKNLRQQSIDFMMESKKSLGESFADREYFVNNEKIKK